MTTVGLLGDGPAMAAIRASIEDTDARCRSVDVDGVDRTDVAVAVGAAGADSLHAAGSAAQTSGTPILIVEEGGIGGVPVEGVDAAVSGHAPATACYECLCGRVAAGAPDTGDDECGDSTARFAGSIAGHELSSLVAGRRSTILGGVIEVPHAERRVLPLPGCGCGAERDASLGKNHEDRSLEESLERAEVAFDAQVGPIANVGEVESFPLPYYLATLSDVPFSDAEVPEHAAGVAADWDPAFMKALGEALERYAAGVYRTSNFERYPTPRVAPARFVAPDDWTQSVDYWHEAEHLLTGEETYLPAELVVFPPPEREIRPPITTGLALGNGGVDALLSGLYEVVERDATMLSWYSTYEPLGLDVDDDGFETLSRRAGCEELEVTALSLTQDVDVPVVTVCVHRDGEWPRFAAGSSANLDPCVAARGALEEALQNWLELRRMGPERASDESGAIGPYAEFPDAAREFVAPESTVPASSVGPTDVPDGSAELEAVVERVDRAGLDAYGARLTPRDVEELGFEAVRVVVPEAQPLFTDDPYFGERARDVPESLGFEPDLEREHHPFP